MRKGYSSVFFKEYIDFFLNLAKKGVKLEIAVSEDVLAKILSEFAKEFEEGISCENVRFYVSKKFKFSFVVTESCLSLSFYFKTGVFDYKRDFVWKGKEAVDWGNDHFEFVKKNSERIKRQRLKELLRNL